MSDDGAKILAEWLGYAWDGLGDQDISDRYPDWSYGGCGHKSPQGGKPAFRKIVQAITAAEHDAAIARAEAAEAQVAALTAKVDALCSKGQCGCSWDREGDVCEYHSPKLVAAEAQIAKLREAAKPFVEFEKTMRLGWTTIQEAVPDWEVVLKGSYPIDERTAQSVIIRAAHIRALARAALEPAHD